MNIAYVGWLAVSFAVVADSAADAPSVEHVPPANATAGTSLELIADAPAATPTLTLHYRASGEPRFETLELVRQGDRKWVAVIPAGRVSPPAIDYYLAAGGQVVFASEAWPHTMPVTATASSERKARDQVRARGRRSRASAMFDYVDYGSRTRDDERLVDHYYRVDLDFAYRLWAYPLEELRVGYTRLLGETQSMECADPQDPPPCVGEAGFKVAGWFELGLGVAEGVRLDGRLILMATQSGFQPGTRLEGRLGAREGSHVAVGFEYLADVGANGFFRLGWGTVPRLPMMATVEITNLPDADRDTGVRLYYDVAHALDNGLRIGLRVGYAARLQQVAGFTGGASAGWEF